MEIQFTTGNHPYLTPSEQIEELGDFRIKRFCFSMPHYTEEHQELEMWKCRWATHATDSRLLIVSNIELAARVRADGVILKPGDLPAKVARSLMGEKVLVAGMASSFDEVVNFAIEGVDEIFIGPVFADSAGRHLGFERLKTLLTLLEMQGIELPIWVFGGVTPDHIPKLETLPIVGASISSYIVSVEEIGSNIKMLKA
jgi:thiamine monophosphate synthase